MFDSIGWPEIFIIGLAALFIFGPERLPHLAKDAASALKKAKAAITGVREQVHESMGDDLAELRDLDLRKYHPRAFIRDQLLGDDEEPVVHRGSATGSAGLAEGAVGAPVTRAGMVRPRDHSTPPPFDADAT